MYPISKNKHYWGKKGQIGPNTIIVCDFSTPLSSIDHPNKQTKTTKKLQS
jgi:hypothetical protein